MLPRLALLSLLVLPGVAYAGDCQTPYNGAQLLNDIQMLQLSLRNEDDTSFATAAARLDVGVPCLTSPAPPQVFAAAYRMLGLYYYQKQDEALARRWLRSSLELDPSYEFGAEDLPFDSPLRGIFEDERNNLSVEVRALPDMELNIPAGSRLAIDGRPLTVAAATPERFHLVQQLGSDNGVRSVWLISGNDLPPQVIKPKVAAEPVEEPKKKKSKPAEATATTAGGTTTGQPRRVERQRPPEKTPLMIAGAVVLVGAGATYATAVVLEQQLHPDADGNLKYHTPDEVDAAASMVNGLILGAGGLAVAGVGLGYWGFSLDEHAWGVQFVGHF